jgi:ABC-2 type transport system ATP-binding protein
MGMAAECAADDLYCLALALPPAFDLVTTPRRLHPFVVCLGIIALNLRFLPLAAKSPAESARGGARMNEQNTILFEDVSKFYGEVLGVNRVNLSLPPGVTSLVGPNGSGKTTLMNLMTGLIKPTQGRISVRGIAPDDPEELFRHVGYCTQFDSFPKGVTGYGFINQFLRLRGLGKTQAHQLTLEALERTGMTGAAHRRVAGYSKGMRQRIRLAQAIAHHPTVLVLDEPLNGLDPMARAESIALFEALGKQGLHVIISSHVLHEVDKISDQVVLMSYGYVIAEGQIQGVRSEVKEHPMQILVRCAAPALLASRLFSQDHVVEARLNQDGQGVLVRTRDAEQFYLLLNRIVVEERIDLQAVAPADDDVNSVYQYLIGGGGGTV